MFPGHLQSKCLGFAHPLGFTAFEHSAVHSKHQFTHLSISNLHPISLPVKVLAVHFCLTGSILSFIIFPNSRNWKDFCCVHCWKHNTNPLQSLWGLTSALNNKVACYICQCPALSHKIVYWKRRQSPSPVAREIKASFNLLQCLLTVKNVFSQALQRWSLPSIKSHNPCLLPLFFLIFFFTCYFLLFCI